MSAAKNISSFRLASLLRLENNPSAAIKLFGNPDPESTNPQKPFRYSLLCYDLIITKLGGSKMIDELDHLPPPAQKQSSQQRFYYCGAFDKAKEVLTRVGEFGKPDACTYNVLISGYSQSGLCPTVHVYAFLIKALCRVGELSLAFKLKDEVKVDSSIYYTLISLLIKDGRSNEVPEILEEMREKGCEPDKVTYNVLVNGFCVENDLESAYRVLDEMVEKGLKPDVISYNMILGALFRIRNWKGAYSFEDMPRRGSVPDILSHRIVFYGLCEDLQLEEAVVVLEEMLVISSLNEGNAVDAGCCEERGPLKLTLVLIPVYIIMFIRVLCNDLKVKEALKMKHDMLKVYGVFPTVHIYASLIKALCQDGELGLAFKLKDEVKADSAIYSTLISSLIKAGRSDEVSGILEEMREKGCEPDTVTYNVLINGFCLENDFESAYKVLDDMVEKGLKPDVISYNMILGALFRIQNWKEGAYLFEDMPRRGCVPDVLSYRIVFDGLCEGLQFEEAAVILDEMMFKGYKPRRDRLERFLQRLCESEKMEILGDVISSLNKGNAYDADFWKSVLKGVGRLDFPAKQARGMNLRVKMVQKKVAVLYHYPCHDGVFAALAAHLYFSANSIPSLFFPNTVYSPITISKLPLQDISHLYLLDFTGPPGFVQQVSPKVDNVVILDHHKTAIESLGDVSSTCKNVTKVLDIGRSGATIAFDYFTQKLKEESRGNCREMDEFKRMRRVFEYIEDADIWKWNLPESKAFNSGIIDLGIEYNFNQNSSLFQQLLSLDHDTVINRGRESLSRKRKLIQEALEQSYEIVLGGGAEEFGRCLAVNEDEIAELRSELGNQLAEKSKGMRLRGVGAVVYRVPELGDETKLKISLRSVEEEDTTVVSQRFGGGGHKNASSFLLSSTEFEQWKVKRNSCSYTLN
ncbi:hypothetical protein HID58_057648 [Brassica napus]|uniref:DHHA1 domain-containing protein n=2 Tax=Brassica napus TaxID=3708 RepID=A0ABQ8ARP4_BRANA|nr:hypothetical protein HID58_057648 [Brassica napus]